MNEKGDIIATFIGLKKKKKLLLIIHIWEYLDEIDQFLKISPKIKQNLHCPITIKEVEFVVVILLKNKPSVPDGFMGKFYQIPILNTLFQKIKRRKYFSTHFESSIIKTKQRQYKNEKYISILFMNIDAKILKKILANYKDQYIKRIIY